MTISADLAQIVRSLPDDRLLELVGPVLLSRAQEVLGATGKRIALKRRETDAERDVMMTLNDGPRGVSLIVAACYHPRKTIENTLTRLRKQGRVVNRDGLWWSAER